MNANMNALAGTAQQGTGQVGPTPVAKKSDENEAVTIQLPKHVFDWFKKQADADERSVAKFIARHLRDHHEQATTTPQHPVKD